MQSTAWRMPQFLFEIQYQILGLTRGYLHDWPPARNSVSSQSEQLSVFLVFFLGGGDFFSLFRKAWQYVILCNSSAGLHLHSVLCHFLLKMQPCLFAPAYKCTSYSDFCCNFSRYQAWRHQVHLLILFWITSHALRHSFRLTACASH